LTLLVKAAKDVGYEGKFYTFYGNALGAPAAMGEAGVGKVLAVAEWMPNVPGSESTKFYQSFKQRFPKPAEDYLHLRMQLMVEALAQSIERAGQSDPLAVALQLENAEVSMAGQRGKMRSTDHQFQQPMVVAVMAKQGGIDVPFDVEGSGYGFKVLRQFKAQEVELPTACKMIRPH
jgi:branched-chain amino acid transport system substrate-binding protein